MALPGVPLGLGLPQPFFGWLTNLLRQVNVGITPGTFAQLPSNPTIGMTAPVTDSNTNVWGANVAGGGANTVLCWWNGTHWTVVGK